MAEHKSRDFRTLGRAQHIFPRHHAFRDIGRSFEDRFEYVGWFAAVLPFGVIERQARQRNPRHFGTQIFGVAGGAR